MKQNKPASIGKNYLYNTAYQLLTLLIPMITTPYASRVFGPDGIGIQSYTNSMATIFSLFAALGVLAYGQREIALHRDDPKQISKLFWEIALICAITTPICLGIWLIVSLIETSYTPYLLVSGMTILAVAFDISWFFAGLEEFRFIVLRNTAVKLIGIAFLFLAVREKNDLLMYIALLAATGLLGNITMWTYLPKFLVPVDWKNLQVFRHFKHTLIYFIPTISASVYSIVDKAMLRFLVEGTEQNGYYEQATKIVRIAQTLLLSINTVMTSRMSYLFAQNKLEELKQRLSQSMSFILLLAFPFVFGIIGIAADFVPWFFGADFSPVIGLLWIYSTLLLPVAVSNCLGTQYLTPSGQRGRSSKGIILGAVINVFLNSLLIPKFGASGAAFSSVIAECVIAAVYIYMSKGYVSLRMLWTHSQKRLIAAFIMLLAVLSCRFLPFTGILLTVMQIGIGTVVYAALLLLLKDTLLLDALSKVRAKLLK